MGAAPPEPPRNDLTRRSPRRAVAKKALNEANGNRWLTFCAQRDSVRKPRLVRRRSKPISHRRGWEIEVLAIPGAASGSNSVREGLGDSNSHAMGTEGEEKAHGRTQIPVVTGCMAESSVRWLRSHAGERTRFRDETGIRQPGGAVSRTDVISSRSRRGRQGRGTR